MRILLCIMLVLSLSGLVGAKEIKRNSSIPAKKLFSRVKVPAPMKPHAIGGYARGCLAGGESLPKNGPGWQVMRLSRNRFWGHPELIAFIERLAKDVKEKDGLSGILVGDLAQPRGGPMSGMHASHQSGLDVDLWLDPMPKKILSNKERENMSATSMTKSRTKLNPKTWTIGQAKLLRRAALDKKVARIFINAAIKKRLCEWSKGQKDRSYWMSKIRPWYGHKDHLHVRLTCPKSDHGCKNQAPPPPGPGCGSNLAWWLSDKPYRHVPKPGEKVAKPREVRLADLPKECTIVLNKHEEEEKDKKVAAKINQVNEKDPPTSGYLD